MELSKSITLEIICEFLLTDEKLKIYLGFCI